MQNKEVRGITMLHTRIFGNKIYVDVEILVDGLYTLEKAHNIAEDSDNWLKGSIEYENEKFQHLGSVVTNNGYSDRATTEIDASVKLVFMHVVRKILLLKLHLQIWKLRSANGWLMTDSNLIKSNF